MRAWTWLIASLIHEHCLESPVGFRDQNLCLPKTSSIQPGVTFHHLQVNTGLSLAILVAFTVSNKDWETTHVVNQPPSQIQTHLCMVSIGTHGAKVNYRDTSNCSLAEILTTAGIL